MVALSMPLGVFSAMYFRIVGALEASATLHAADVADMARVNPNFWDFDGLQVSSPEVGRSSGELRRVYDGAGRLVVESVPARDLSWPRLSHRQPIVQAGERIGVAEATRSFQNALLVTAVTALISGAFGALTFAILRLIPIRRMEQAVQQASYLAAHDLLTGLPNRALYADRLAQALLAARRQGGSLAVLCLDLDHFKEVNDTLGHGAGDDLLRTVSCRLSHCLRESDTLARLGGDEFAIIQVGDSQPSASAGLATRLLEVIQEPVQLSGGQVVVGLSIGIALATPQAGYDPTSLMQNADLALYQAKESGRGAYRFFQPDMNEKLRQRRLLEADLREALLKCEFKLAFQPQYSLARKCVTGAEALLRWDRPGKGNMPPDQFIPLAEETGLITPIGNWVLREACRCAATWPGEMSVAVNVSPSQFRHAGLYDTVVTALQESGLPSSRLELEITEGVLLNETNDTLALLAKLRELGVKIAMDDFGTGYSSLGYLQKFTFDKIKIDRSFIERIGHDTSAKAIIRAVVGMTHALGIKANAEGVEFEDQADILADEGCEEVQGYFFAKPMPEDAFLRWVGFSTDSSVVSGRADM
jgi:diguanylate cyclase (GGDEF)-like protein